MVDFLHTIVSGVQMGTIYAFLALAITLVYRSTGIINFAQGEMAMFATFIAWALVAAGLPVLVAVLIAMALAFVMGGVVEITLFRKVVTASNLHAPTILTVGLFLILNNLAGAIWRYDPHIIRIFPEGVLTLGGVRLPYQTLGTLALLLIATAALYLLFTSTRLGLALRATVSNRESAGLSGVNVGRMLMLGWCMAAALGALAGALVAPALFLSPNMMAPVLAYALAGAALGGFGSLPGAVVGSLIIGITEALAASYVGFIGSDLKVLVPVVALFIILLLRPQGLYGVKSVARV